MPQKLTRAQIKEGLDTIPIETLLSSGEGKTPKLTSKQRAFAHALALGETKAEAYRKAYKRTASKRTLACKPYELARDERIQREVEAYTLALEAEKHRTPAQLKALLVQQLVQHSLDDEFPPAQRMKALQLIGQLFEVGAFLERKETTVVHKSSDIRTRLLERLGKVSDVEAKRDDALTLLEEIKGSGLANAPVDAPTDGVGEPVGVVHTGDLTHTVSDIQSLDSSVPDIQTLEKSEEVPHAKNPDTVLDFDKE
jgi:hypothetical protein